MAVESSQEKVYAGFWKRAVAFAIDQSLIAGVAVLVWFCYFEVKMIEAYGQGGDILEQMSALLTILGQFTSLEFEVHNVVDMQILWNTYIVYWFYAGLFESSRWQATPGKRFMNIYVVDYENQRLDFTQAFGRNVAKLFSDVMLGIGYILAGITRHKQALHDMVAKCMVVRGRM